MKKIVPFNNVLTFNTDICEITAISLEHDIKKESDALSGTFYISGEYKITDGQLEKDKFNFELPFDIALGCNYHLDTLVVDIDDFRYEQISKNEVKVNIDLSIEGEEILPENINERTEPIEPTKIEIDDNLELLDEMLDNKKIEQPVPEENIEIENTNTNIFNAFNEEEQYVTYKVYRVIDNDTLDGILEKYKVSKEELAKYNNLDEIHPGIKLIIPYNDK